MKRIVYMMIAVSLLAGCNKIDNKTTDDTVQAGLNLDGKDCLVAINPIGEITTSETPLTKGSSTPTDDIYLVQVMQKVLENNQPTYRNFAMGYFDNLDAMKLYLKQGAPYRIIVVMVKNAKNLLGTRYNLTQASLRSCVVENNNFTGYKDVFDFLYQRDGSNDYSNDADCYNIKRDNKWFYAIARNEHDNIYTWQYYSSTLSSAKSNDGKYFPINHYFYVFKHQIDYYENKDAVEIKTDKGYYTGNFDAYCPYLPFIEQGNLANVKYPTCDGWFYGEAVDYNPTGDYEQLDINFRRVGFGLKYELSGVTDGEVTVKIYNGTRTFIENTTNTANYSNAEQFIAFYNARDAWMYADNYSENLTVAVTWKRGIGVTQDLGTKTIQVKRNCMNNVKIRLGSDDRNAQMMLSAEAESSMGASSTEIPVQ